MLYLRNLELLRFSGERRVDFVEIRAGTIEIL